jgi:hypothetical protein
MIFNLDRFWAYFINQSINQVSLYTDRHIHDDIGYLIYQSIKLAYTQIDIYTMI